MIHHLVEVGAVLVAHLAFVLAAAAIAARQIARRHAGRSAR